MHAVVQKRGITAVEILVGVSIAALILVFSTHAMAQYINAGRDIGEQTQALYLAEEALELVRFTRDNAWANIDGLTDGQTYYLSVAPGGVSISGTPEVIDGYYTRSFSVAPVERDGNDDIVSSGTPDDNTKYVTATVTWGSETLSLTTVLADIRQP